MNFEVPDGFELVMLLKGDAMAIGASWVELRQTLSKSGDTKYLPLK